MSDNEEQPVPLVDYDAMREENERQQEEYLQRLVSSMKRGMEATMGCTLEEKEQRKKEKFKIAERQLVALERIAAALCYAPQSIGYDETKEDFESY